MYVKYCRVWCHSIMVFEARQNHVLSVTSFINCIVAHCLINVVCLYQVMMTLHFLYDVANDTESTQKKYVIIASLDSETMGKLVNRILCKCLLTSNLPAPLGERMLNRSASLAISKPCHVNLISKDTHLVFSICQRSNLFNIHSKKIRGNFVDHIFLEP